MCLTRLSLSIENLKEKLCGQIGCVFKILVFKELILMWKKKKKAKTVIEKHFQYSSSILYWALSCEHNVGYLLMQVTAFPVDNLYPDFRL